MILFDINSILKRVPRIIMAFFLIDVGLCIAYIIDNLIGQPYSATTRLLNLDGESSISTWYSSMQLFCVFILSALYCYHKFKGKDKLSILIFLPIIFLLMSIDESVQIHEGLGNISDILFPSGSREGTNFYRTGIWMFVFGLPFLALFVGFVNSLKRLVYSSLPSLKKLMIGMVIMLTGALGFEFVSNFINDNYIYIEVVFEEGLEMIGVTVMFWAVYEMVLDFIPDFDTIKI